MVESEMDYEEKEKREREREEQKNLHEHFMEARLRQVRNAISEPVFGTPFGKVLNTSNAIETGIILLIDQETAVTFVK